MRNFTEVSLLVCICPRDESVSFLFHSMKLIVSIHETQGAIHGTQGAIHGTQGFNIWNAQSYGMRHRVSDYETYSLKI